MPLFLDTRSESLVALAICDRCNFKFPIVRLMSDPNSPGLRVCRDCLDQFDPYRLAARQTETINLPFVWPDVDLTFPGGDFVPDFLEPPIMTPIILTDDTGDTVLTDDSGGFNLIAQ